MKANMYYTLGDYQKALNELIHLDKIHPKLALVNYTMAKAYHQLGQKYLGNKHMQIANELDPKGNHKQKGKAFDILPLFKSLFQLTTHQNWQTSPTTSGISRWSLQFL